MHRLQPVQHPGDPLARDAGIYLDSDRLPDKVIHPPAGKALVAVIQSPFWIGVILVGAITLWIAQPR